MEILQIKRTTPNPVTSISGYEPTTDYWDQVIVMVNSMLQVATLGKHNLKDMKRGAGVIITLDIFPDEQPHSPVEWAEFVMAINHVLWLLHEMRGTDKYVDMALETLDYLYYKWHNKALDTLKGSDLSRYLEITD